MGVGKKYTATTSQTMGQKKAQGALATGAPFELGPGARARRPAARARRLKNSTRTERVRKKRKEAPADCSAARAGTGNTNRSPSLASQTIENQHTNHQPLA